MLLTIIFLLLVALLGGFTVHRIKRDDQQATRRRRQSAPRLGCDVLGNATESSKRTAGESVMDFDSEETDDTLGADVQACSPVQDTSKEVENAKVRCESTSSDYITLHVIAPQEYPYNGYELLQSLLASGLRYGAYNIFHRHETKTGRGRVLFSVASVNKPGTFELSKMGSFSCPGLTLFMVLKDAPDAMKAFDTLLEVAKQLAEDLGGEVWDEKRNALKKDKVAELRAYIKQFERNQQTPDFFDAELQPE